MAPSFSENIPARIGGLLCKVTKKILKSNKHHKERCLNAHFQTDFCDLSCLGWKAKMSEGCRVAQGIGGFNLESYAWGVVCELHETERPYRGRDEQEEGSVEEKEKVKIFQSSNQKTGVRAYLYSYIIN